jgi:putative ABC transport system permease protein
MMRQALAVTGLALKSLPHRASSAWVVVSGVAATVAILVSLLALESSVSATVAGGARADRAVILSDGAQGELTSGLSRENARTILQTKGVEKTAAGDSVGSAEVVTIAKMTRRFSESRENLTLRGIGPLAFDLRPEVVLVAGRKFRPAVNELIVGQSAAAQFRGLDMGSELKIRDSYWKVVGIFQSSGNSQESEVLGDADTMLSALGLSTFQSVTLLLKSKSSFDEFKDELLLHSTNQFNVRRETDYLTAQSARLTTLLGRLAAFVGGVMALGAIFATVNAMNSVVAARTIEIATLRAIGFGNAAIVFSLLAEAIILAAVGTMLGVALVWLVFSGSTWSTVGGNFNQVVMHLKLDFGAARDGAMMAGFVALGGTIVPAIRAVRIEIAMAIRAT